MVKVILSVCLIFISYVFASSINIKHFEKKDIVYISNIQNIEEIPFIDPSFLVIQLNGVDSVKLRKRKTDLLKDINIIKTVEGLKIVFELKSSNVKHFVKRRKGGFEIVFYSNEKNLALKSRTKHIVKFEKKKNFEPTVKLEPINLLQKIPKNFKFTLDPVFYILVSEGAKKKDFSLRKKLIMIDPGHGGADPGAIANGVVESKINWKIAMYLKKLLEKDGRFKVLLTRKKNETISPYRRSIRVMKYHPDLLISIHCNSAPNPNARGTYIYTLSLEGAKKKLTRLVESRENRENPIFIKEVRVSRNWYVNKIVAELAINTTVVEGFKFAYTLKRKLNYITTVKDIDSGNFIVLKNPGIPSILIETAFLTNKYDAKLLKNNIFLKNFAASIYLGIVDYFYNQSYIVVRRWF